MIITRIKTAAVISALLFGVTHVQANMLQNLADVANGALPSYGRTDAPSRRTDLSAVEVSNALRELLTIGCNNVVEKLQQHGYSDPAVRVELPKRWAKARDIAARIGYSREFDKLEQRLGEIAVAIAPATRDLLNEMIADLEIDDPLALLASNDDAATLELKRRVTARLVERLHPIVNESLASSGVLKIGDEIVRQVKHLPASRLLETDFTGHVIDESVEGFFHYLAQEERAIRSQPFGQPSDLLRRVLG